VEAGDVDFWDWRDCKEQSHRLNTQLSLIIRRLASASAAPPPVENESTAYLVETMFTLLGERRAILVFDNTDQYVDVERGRFVGGLDVLVARGMRIGHRTTLIFT
jgi:hypothetical protein